MLTVVIETRNEEAKLALSLAWLVPAAVDGVVRDVIVCDGGSTDGTRLVVEHAGCRWVGEGGLAEAFTLARGDWLLLLAPGMRLGEGWIEAVERHVSRFSTPARLGPSGAISLRLCRLLRVATAEALLIRRDQAQAVLVPSGGRQALSGGFPARHLKVAVT